jgi:uncharacterized membrane protein YdbT with pleckstrin-like domain
MSGSARGWLLRVLKVPTAPSVPYGARDVQVFRASPNYYRYKIAIWILGQIGALAGLIGGLVFLSQLNFGNRYAMLAIGGLEALCWIGYLLQLPFSYLLVRLDFEMRWYILAERSLRIREGIVSLREKTITFANVQQISIRQNPLQRVLGIADIQVRTAGGGSAPEGKGKHMGESMHEAWFRGVDNAATIRDAIRDRVRSHRDAGLGDPDDTTSRAATIAQPLTGAIAAARLLHHEVRQLRLGLVAAPPSDAGTT